MNKPIGAYANIKWLDDSQRVDGYYFSFGECDEENPDFDSFGVPDDRIFFYCDGESSLQSFMTEGMADFVVLSYELEYSEVTV